MRSVSGWHAAVVLTAALLLGRPVPADAHDPGLSSLDVRVSPGRVVATLSLAPADARTLVDASRSTFIAAALDGVDLRIDGVRLTATASALAHATDAAVVLTFVAPPGGRLAVRSAVLDRLAFGHRQLLTVRSADGVVLAERMLDARDAQADVDLSAAGRPDNRAVQFFDMGVRHILSGYDHLLFLGALLLGLRRVRDVVKTVTAFTVAHSVTLAAAVLGVARAPSGIVEPLIAMSVVYVGVANLLQRQVDSRWKLTFAFGIVHGLGFAGALQDAGIGAGVDAGRAVATALGAFNVGVEAGQIGVALLLWPLMLYLDARPALRVRVMPLCSAIITAAGTYWLWQRSLGS